jgi:hypothetical protein
LISGDFLAYLLHQAEFGRDRAAHADDAGQAWSGSSQSEYSLVVHGGRAEVPDVGLLVAGQQAEAAHLVPLPLADLGRGDVADVVDVEEQQACPQFDVLQGLPWSGQAVAAQPVVIDPAFEIDGGMAPGRAGGSHSPVRLDVLRLSACSVSGRVT